MNFFNCRFGKKLLLAFIGLFIGGYTVAAANTITVQKVDTQKKPDVKLEYKLTVEQKTQLYFTYKGNEPGFTPLNAGSYIIQISVINNKIFFELYDMDENPIARLPGVAVNSNARVENDLSGNTTLRLNQTRQLFHTKPAQWFFSLTLKSL